MVGVNVALGDKRADDVGRCRNNHTKGKGEISSRKPRIISDNGPQFIARDFKEFIRVSGKPHPKTTTPSSYYPQSNAIS